MAALEQIAEDQRKAAANAAGQSSPLSVGPTGSIIHQPPAGVTPTSDADGPATPPPQPAPQPKNAHFFMSAKLDNTRINRDVQHLVEEVISHLASVDGGVVDVCLEVTVDAPDGIPQSTVRTVSENCQVLKVKDFGVEG